MLLRQAGMFRAAETLSMKLRPNFVHVGAWDSVVVKSCIQCERVFKDREPAGFDSAGENILF